MTHIGKVAVSVLEHHVKNFVGDEAIAELRQPLVEQELRRSIAEATQHAEQRWVEEYEDRNLAAAVRGMPLHDLPSVQQALCNMYDHPSDPVTAELFREKLNEILPPGFSAERIEQAVASYIDLLRTELISIPGVREKIDALAGLETARNTARTAEETQRLNTMVKQLNTMVAQLLSKEVQVTTLDHRLQEGEAGSWEFARIVALLRFHEARRAGNRVPFPQVSAGYAVTMRATSMIVPQLEDGVTCHTMFCSSPFGSKQRQEIIDALKHAGEARKSGALIRKWILVTPHDLAHSSNALEDDITWFRGLRESLVLDFELEHWGHIKLLSLFKQTPAMCLYYYPELVENGPPQQRTIQDTTRRYIDNLFKLHRHIEFVGMSVYKPEAAQGVPIEDIYIPLEVVPAASSEDDPNAPRFGALTLRAPGAQHVVLGDPGSGKSTLLRFLALAGCSQQLQQRYGVPPDEKRLPIFITLRRYTDELKQRINLSLIDYIQEVLQANFSLESADLNFFEYYLETGQAILLFDGLDEQDAYYKELARNRIRALVTTYPGNTLIVTSRIVGYDYRFRFNEDEFKHYRVAKLRLPEIERFVHDWYRVRIENECERQANIDDLVNILGSEDHTAIRDLAENPLLLTIIALVHRIDAVLPDERVVLYQKCTETLLNTWHAWKFRNPEVKHKGRIERRNRRRIEAIAHWMQQRMSGDQKQERAVVPYVELRSFLTGYISSNERTSNLNAEPQDLAEEFLEFIKERAGLMIEVGDQQYSFVHLTFQEYLTASYISATSEIGGVEAIWTSIAEHYDSANWHEVVRLLVASLRAEETKEYLIEKILNETQHHRNRVLLLGGLLIDSIEAAELYQQDIVTLLLRAGIVEKDIVQLRRLTAMMRTWQNREDLHTETIRQAFYTVWTGCNPQQRYALRLVAIILGWTEKQVSELTGDVPVANRETELLRLFFGGPEALGTSSMLQREMELLWLVQQWFSLTSPYTNFAAAAGLAVTAAYNRAVFMRAVFELVLTTLGIEVDSGPYQRLIEYKLAIAAETTSLRNSYNPLSSALDRLRLRERNLFQEREQFLNQSILKARISDDYLHRDRSINRAWYRIYSLAQNKIQHLKRDQYQSPDWALEQKEHNANFWQSILASHELYEPLLEVLDSVFDLPFLAQWREALRTAFASEVPRRISILFDQEQWQHVENAFEQNNAGESEIYFAAWLLLLDCWLYIFEVYKTPDETFFASLVDLTCTNDAPVLCIAHCIRDLAYGNESRIEDLVAMVQSDDPAYRTIFETCLWRPTPEEAAREAE
jgi:hypothetical protein